jgi:hypothetical protein
VNSEQFEALHPFYKEDVASLNYDEKDTDRAPASIEK